MVKQIYKIPMPLSMEEYNLAQHYVTMVEKIAPSDPGKYFDILGNKIYPYF